MTVCILILGCDKFIRSQSYNMEPETGKYIAKGDEREYIIRGYPVVLGRLATIMQITTLN